MNRVYIAPVRYLAVPNALGYSVGDDGSVWSHWKRCGKAKRVNDPLHWQRLKDRVDNRGYHWVALSIAGQYLHRKVGRLVLEAFIGPKPETAVVRHLDDVKANNALTNLAYGTVADNAEDARRNGRIREGGRHGRAVYTDEQIREVRRLRSLNFTHKRISEKTGVKKPTVAQILAGRQWRSVP